MHDKAIKQIDALLRCQGKRNHDRLDARARHHVIQEAGMSSARTTAGLSIAKIKGNFRLKGIRSTNPVAVGDFVQITVNAEGTAFITEIEDRKNYIIRKASNLSKQSHIHRSQS